MIENNEIGRKVRRYFIECEKKLREDLIEKAAHVLPLFGSVSMHDQLSMRHALQLQEQSRKVLRMIFEAPTQAERQNLHFHFRQLNLVLGVETIPLEDIEAEIAEKKEI